MFRDIKWTVVFNEEYFFLSLALNSSRPPYHSDLMTAALFVVLYGNKDIQHISLLSSALELYIPAQECCTVPL